MFRRILFLMMTLFVCTVGAVAVGDDATLFRTDGTEIQKPYSCVSDILGSSGNKTVLMTPIFKYSCGAGLVTNATNDGCDYVEYFAHPGYYVDMENPDMRKDCPFGFWCPGSENNYLPIDNENDCNAVTTAGLEWHDSACFIKDTAVTVNINSQEQCDNASGLKTVWENGKCELSLTTASNAYICGGADNVAVEDYNSWSTANQNGTTLGICKCPAGTTTGAKESTGKNASVIQQCNWYKLDPGQQLKKDEQNNTYSAATCDENHYCEGGIYDTAHYTDSMMACPKKHINTQDTGTPSLEGTAVAGSFRCAYSCDAGYYMHIANNGWKNAYSTCELCPEGWYCPGNNGEAETYLTPTEYDPATYATEKDKYTGTTELGKIQCESGTTTNGRGAKTAGECKTIYTCPAGQYLHVPANGTPTCEPCSSGFEWHDNGCFVKGTSIKISINSQEQCENAAVNKSFCPGGSYTADQADETGNAGIYACGQNINHITDGLAWDDLNNPVVPTENQSACTCPEGYAWNSKTLACCNPNKGCCGPGYMPMIDARTNEFLGCDKCQGNWGAEDDPDDPNHVYCPGTELTLKCDIDPINGYRYNNECLVCGNDSVPGKPNQYTNEPDSCTCTGASMAAVYPDEPHEENDILVRSWDRGTGKCELNKYSVHVWYSNVDLDGRVNTHGKWSYGSQYPYWSQDYKYGRVKNGNNGYIEQDSFVVNWNPSDYGFVFTNPDTPRKVQDSDGYVFAGWCRETSFCCPAGYEVHDLENGKKECVVCADPTSANCDGSLYTPTNEKPNIDTKAAENRKGSITYYAILVSEKICNPGEYLNTGNLECEACPVGHYCPGGGVSTNNTGKYECPVGTYRQIIGATQMEYDAVTGDGCKPCEIGVEEALNISIPDGNLNGLTTKTSASTSLSQCGYYCNADYHDADDNRFKCDADCEAGSYCPGAGPTPYGWAKQFYSYTEPGKGMLDCPTGLTSDAKARNCYKSNCEATTYTKATYVDDKQNFGCTPCDGNNPQTGQYYYCTGGKISVPLNMYSTKHQDSAGKSTCPGGQVSDEPADYCYNVHNPGQYQKPDGTYDYCPSGSFCPMNTTEPLNCPLGSTSPVGASSVYHCQCLSDLDLEDGASPEYRPDGVYAEKGAKIHYDTTTGKYICVNTYLAVGNTESYEAATNGIPFAEARVVSCQWGSDQQTVGKYDKCTNKAMTICEKDTWTNDFVGTESQPVEISDVLTRLATAFEETNVADVVDNMTTVADVRNIETVGVCETTVCNDEFAHYDELANHCYASIDYNLNDGELPDGKSNPDRYVASDLPIVLNNPEKLHHKFNGWCLDNEETAICLANNIQSGVDPETGEETTFIQRTIETGTTGDLLFNAEWQMVCPVDYKHYTGELTDVTQCYATVDFNTNGGTPVPETVEKHYTEGATTYTLSEFPAVALTGYKFAGWYDNENFDGSEVELATQENVGTQLLGDTTLYANWDPITYSVAFNGNGYTSGSMEAESFEYDEEKALTANSFTKTGYNFNGWCDAWNTEANACTTNANSYSDKQVVSNLTTIDNKVITMFAKWNPITYSVVFNGNNATSGEMANESFNYDEEKALTENMFEKTGYNFNGWCDAWNTEANACATNANTYSDKQVVSNLTTTDNAIITMFAKWNPITYSVAFNGNGNTDGSMEAESFEYDEEKALTENAFEKTGYNFDGWCDAWNTEADACATNANNYSDKQVVSNLTTTGNAIITMFAKWNPINYSITYNGMDDAQVSSDPITGEPRVNPTTYTVEDDVIVYNAADTTDYEFLGWCEGGENQACSTPQKDVSWLAGAKTGNLVFTAQWKALACPEGFPIKDTEGVCYANIVYYRVPSNAVWPVDPEHEGEYLTNPSRYDAGTSLPITLYNPSVEHYTFEGWYDNDEYVGAAVTQISEESTGHKAFWAKWTPVEYAITYHNVDGTDVKWPVDLEHEGSYLTNPTTYTVESDDITLYNPSKDLYAFVGWCDDEALTLNCTTTKTIESGSSGHKEFWAKWTLKSYTVVFDKNASDAEGSKANATCEYGVVCDIANNNEITRTDYAFVGWSTQSNGTAVEYTDSMTQNTVLTDNTLTLYAIWTPVCNTGKRLHIGDADMCLYSGKRTTPSLVFMIDDEKYYANMCKASECDNTVSADSESKLHIMYNDEIYNVYDLTAQ